MKPQRYLPVACALIWAIAGSACHHDDPDALWKIVHQRCVPDQQQHGVPAPCALVDLAAGEDKGYAVLKDRNGPTQYLLIPTAPLSGIEMPRLLAADAPPYFAEAWEARSFVERAAQRSLPREALESGHQFAVRALAESVAYPHRLPQARSPRCAARASGRSRRALGAAVDVPLAGRRYRAMRISEAAFSIRPIRSRLLALDPAGMAREHTLVVAGATFEDQTPGFILLDDSADLWRLDRGHGEDLQSHSCWLIE